MMSAPLMASMPDEPGDPHGVRVLLLVASIVFFPLRHPIRFLAIALVAFLLFYALRGVVPSDGVAAIRQSADKAMSSVSSFVNAQILRRPKEVTALPTAPTPAPSPPAASPTPSPPSSSATSSAPPQSARSLGKCTGSSCIASARTGLGGSRIAIGCACRSTGFTAASRREERSAFKVGNELWHATHQGLVPADHSKMIAREPSMTSYRKRSAGDPAYRGPVSPASAAAIGAVFATELVPRRLDFRFCKTEGDHEPRAIRCLTSSSSALASLRSEVSSPSVNRS